MYQQPRITRHLKKATKMKDKNQSKQKKDIRKKKRNAKDRSKIIKIITNNLRKKTYFMYLFSS